MVAESPDAMSRGHANAPDAAPNESIATRRPGQAAELEILRDIAGVKWVAPNAAGAVSGMTERSPFTITRAPFQRNESIRMAPPGVPRNCHGGLTWKGRMAA